MHVLATAGHVDHGKSTLVQALTGRDPDQLAEEKRRGLTIELGFAWTTLAGGQELAFVDVPGHERFLATTLAGMGPVPAVLFVVSADEGWRRQSAEHLSALAALGVEHGLLVITRSDLTDPEPAALQTLSALKGSPLEGLGWVGVSARTGLGMPELRHALATVVDALPTPDPDAPVRLWVDRTFTVVGVGTVVTGTLGAGRVSVGDTLELGGEPVVVRGIESLGLPRQQVTGTARVALALRGVGREQVSRGDALLTPGHWHHTQLVDARLTQGQELGSRTAQLHIGSAHLPVAVRMLSQTHVRLQLDRPLPLVVGDRALLRDPGGHRVAGGLIIVDVDPPVFSRRGDPVRRAATLTIASDRPDPVLEVARRGFSTRAELAALGVLAATAELPAGLRDVGGRLLTESAWTVLTARIQELIPVGSTGVVRAELIRLLGLPDPAVLDALVASVSVLISTADGRVTRRDATMPPRVQAALDHLRALWDVEPLAAPDAEFLRAHAITTSIVGFLAAQHELVRISPDIAMSPRAPEQATAILAGMPAPFSVSAARLALGSTRRVVVPLLEFLDRRGITRRDPTGLRQVVTARWDRAVADTPIM